MTREQVTQMDPAAAKLELKAQLKQDPDAVDARYQLGLLLRDAGEYANAEAELRRALDAGQPADQVVPALAEVMLKLGKDELLLSEFTTTKLTDLDADLALQTHLAAAQLAVGNLAAARSLVDRTLAKQPDHVPAKLLLARLTALAGDREGALKAVDQLLAVNPDSALIWTLKGDLLKPTGPDTDFGPAIAAWRKGLAQGGDKVALHASVGSALMAQGDYDGAKAQWDLLKQLAGRHPQTVYLEAQLADQRGDLARARELCQQLLRTTPGDLRVLLLAGAVAQKLGARAQAEVLFAKAMLVAPTQPTARHQLASLLVQAGQIDKALEVLKPLLSNSPPDADALALAAQAHLKQGDTQAADTLFAQATKLYPDNLRVRTAMALSQVAKGQDVAGIKALQAIAAADKGSDVDQALILALLRRNDAVGAQRAIDALALKLPKDPLPDELRARIALDAKDSAASRRHLEAALQKNPDYLPALTRLAHLDLDEQKADAAQARFEALLERYPRNTEAMHGMAMVNTRKGGPQGDTTQWLQDAVKADPSDALSHQLLIDHCLASGNHKQAIAAAQNALTALPGDPALLDRLGRALLGTGEPQQAIVAFNRLLPLQPKSALPHLRLAEAHEMLKEDAAAAASWRRALALEPGLLAVQQAAIRLAQYERKPADAMAAVQRIQAQFPGLATGFILEGKLALAQKQWDIAAGAFRKALNKADPGEGARGLYEALSSGGKPGDADKFADDWRQQHPLDLDFAMHQADTARLGGHPAKAEQLYKWLVERQPKHVMALNNLASVMAAQGKQGGSAYAERALSLAPSSMAVMDTLALCLATEKNLDQAIEIQTKVVGTAPEVPSFRLQLAKFHLKAGDTASARTQLKALSRLGAAFPRQTEVRELMRSTGS